MTGVILQRLAPRIRTQTLRLFLFSLLVLSFVLPLLPQRTAAASPWFDAEGPVLGTGNSVSKEDYDELRRAKLGPLAGRSCNQKRIARRAFGSLNVQYEHSCWFNTKIGLLSINGDYLLQPGTEVAGHIGSSSSGQAILLPTPNDNVFLELTPASSVGYGYYIGFRHIDDAVFERTTHTTGTVTLEFARPATSKPRNGITGRRILIDGTLAWSSNGKYLILGSDQGYVYRFNLETFQIITAEVWEYYRLPFAGTTAISPSGQYGALTKEQYSNGSDLYVVDFHTCKNGEQDSSIIDRTCRAKSMRSVIAKSITSFTIPRFPRFFGEHTVGFFHRSPNDTDQYDQYFLQAAGTESTSSSYVALGDSFSAGEGVGHYIAGTDEPLGNVCHTSEKSYPYVINNRLNLSGFASYACSGAMIEHFTTNAQYKDTPATGPGDDTQHKLLSEGSIIPKIVTISLSGNDMGFGEKLRYCLGTPRCYDSYEERVQIAEEITSQHSRLVNEVYKAISVNKQDIKLYVLGYPKLFDDSDTANCAVNVRFGAYQRKMANDLVSYFNAVIKSAAEHAGAFYVDIEEAMAGHRLCEGPSATMALNGLTTGNDTPFFLPIVSNGSYHPNQLGHELFANSILAQTNNFASNMPAPVKNPIPDVHDFAFSNAPVRGYPVRRLYHDPSKNPVLGIKGQHLDVSVNNPALPLKPFSEYHAELHSDPIPLGTVTTNGAGMINASLPLPDNIPAGIHELHIIGQGEDGQDIDVYRLVYIADSAEDFDGDGILNQDEPCGILEPALTDIDQDGIDDGCDPLIEASAQEDPIDTDEPTDTDNIDPNIPDTQEPKDTPAVLADQAAKDEFIQNNLTKKQLTNTGTPSRGTVMPFVVACLLLSTAIVFTLSDRLRYAKR